MFACLVLQRMARMDMDWNVETLGQRNVETLGQRFQALMLCVQ